MEEEKQTWEKDGDTIVVEGILALPSGRSCRMDLFNSNIQMMTYGWRQVHEEVYLAQSEEE